MFIEEQIKYALDLFTDKDDPGTATPFRQNGRVYVTNKKLLLSLPEAPQILEAVEDNGEKHPNAEALFGKEKNPAWNYIDNVSLNVADHVPCNLEGLIFAGENLRLIHEFGCLAGIEEWKVAKYTNSMVIFSALLLMNAEGHEDENIYILAACRNFPLELAESQLVTHYPPHTTEGCLALWEYGAMYYLDCLEQDRIKEEEYEKANFPVFEVTLHKTAYMAVKAKTWEEAQAIAMEYAEHDMFDDSNIDADGYSESCRDWASTSYDHYYDEDGEHDWDEDNEL